ncbi:MAG TPA: hypothetical protein VHW00_19700 [Thermoanaerobaculia bacterium]|nr:hypothetical protein [Thermoanaerobaculia bacterium]
MKTRIGMFLLLCAFGLGIAAQECPCAPGHWWDKNRKSCVTGACAVPNMPDGDKGGGYFAWQGQLFVNTPCACGNLDLTAPTGQPGWVLVSSPGVTTPKAPVVVTPNPGWSTLPGASWVSVDAQRGSAGGDYTYEYTFCLCASAKAPRLDVSLLADNRATVFLNNNQIFATTGNTNFAPPIKTVTYTATPNWIIPGTNKVKIVVGNDSNVTGLAAIVKVVAAGGACPTKYASNVTKIIHN